MNKSPIHTLAALLGFGAVVLAAACAGGGSSGNSTAAPAAGVAMAPAGTVSLAESPALRYPASARVANPDPRVGLRPGYMDAESAIWNMRVVSRVAPSEGFTGRGTTGSDLAFTGDLAIQGTYRGFQIWNVRNPARPQLVSGFICPTSQGDPSVYGNLLFVSGENASARNDCGVEAVQDSVSGERFLGIRIFDISDPARPRLVKNVQTCRGSHTHTVVADPDDDDNVYIYVSGYARVRSENELSGCHSGGPDDPTSAQYRIEIIRVPLANPAQAAVVNSPHLLTELSGRTVHAPPASDQQPGGGRGGGGGGRGGNQGPQIGQSGCHDITSYPEIGYALGACSGYGLLFDIDNVRNPELLLSVADSNMSFWHSATFSNDGDKVLFSDEWGGGGQPRCRATDPLIWGGNAIFTLEDEELDFQSYYKMPGAQAEDETCTAHNGSLIPIPGREVMVQSFYQGGITVFDWTDPANPFEIAFYDEGPASGTGGSGGFWSSYWYNGAIYGSDEGRGFYVWELTPGPYLSQNEIDAMKTVRLDEFNAQMQTRFVWPPSFALARAYLDQMERNSGLAAARIASVRAELQRAESATGAARAEALRALAGSLRSDLSTAPDRGRVARVIQAVEGLAGGE